MAAAHAVRTAVVAAHIAPIVAVVPTVVVLAVPTVVVLAVEAPMAVAAVHVAVVGVVDDFN